MVQASVSRAQGNLNVGVAADRWIVTTLFGAFAGGIGIILSERAADIVLDQLRARTQPRSRVDHAIRFGTKGVLGLLLVWAGIKLAVGTPRLGAVAILAAAGTLGLAGIDLAYVLLGPEPINFSIGGVPARSPLVGYADVDAADDDEWEQWGNYDDDDDGGDGTVSDVDDYDDGGAGASEPDESITIEYEGGDEDNVRSPASDPGGGHTADDPDEADTAA